MFNASELNKEAMLEWVEALESDLYAQGHNTLNLNEEFCCLGVACDVFAERLNLHIAENSLFGTSYNGNSNSLPSVVSKYLGLEYGEENPVVFVSESGAISAIAANDFENWSFKKIAAALRITYDLGAPPDSSELDTLLANHDFVQSLEEMKVGLTKDV